MFLGLDFTLARNHCCQQLIVKKLEGIGYWLYSSLITGKKPGLRHNSYFVTSNTCDGL